GWLGITGASCIRASLGISGPKSEMRAGVIASGSGAGGGGTGAAEARIQESCSRASSSNMGRCGACAVRGVGEADRSHALRKRQHVLHAVELEVVDVAAEVEVGFEPAPAEAQAHAA